MYHLFELARSSIRYGRIQHEVNIDTLTPKYYGFTRKLASFVFESWGIAKSKITVGSIRGQEADKLPGLLS